MRLVHLESGIDSPDDDFATPAALLGAQPTEFGGSTEWIGASDPSVSVGWDWVATADGLMTLRPGTVRTTLMLVDDRGADLGWDATVAGLERYLAGMPWQPVVLEHLRSTPDS